MIKKDNMHVHHVAFPHIKFPHIHFSSKELHDRPLVGKPIEQWHFRLYFCEMLSVIIMIIFALTGCIILSAQSSPVAQFLHKYPLLQSIILGGWAGFAGTVACLSSFGKVSGAHLNPAVSFAFFLARKLKFPDLIGYFCAQLLGAFIGTFIIWSIGQLLPIWHILSIQTEYGGTYPPPHMALLWVAIAEMIATLGMILGIAWFIPKTAFRRFLPWWGVIYFSLVNPFIACISGDSTNFTRTLAPGFVAGHLNEIWAYFIGPFLGSSIAMLIVQSGLIGRIHMFEARIVNFGHYGRIPRVGTPEAVGPSPKELSKGSKHKERT